MPITKKRTIKETKVERPISKPVLKPSGYKPNVTSSSYSRPRETRTERPRLTPPAYRSNVTSSSYSRPENNQSHYRSTGEKLIAEFLSSERIHFVHEYPVALKDEQGQVRIWYPDFFLPGLNIVIEYLGMTGKGEYDRAVRRKTRLFKHLKVDFIYITPNRLSKPNWKEYIVRKILEIMDSKGSEYNKMKLLAKKPEKT